MSFYTKHFLEHLRHYLPSQASLKDFIHHNTLHGFQDRDFHQACFEAAEVFGFSTYLSLAEYRDLYRKGRIRDCILRDRIAKALPEMSSSLEMDLWLEKALHGDVDYTYHGRLGTFRQGWKEVFKINLDKAVHSKLIRVVSAYLDQGISGWKFPYTEAKGLLENLRKLDLESQGLLFGKRRARDLLHDHHVRLETLLEILVGDPRFYEAYVWVRKLPSCPVPTFRNPMLTPSTEFSKLGWLHPTSPMPPVEPKPFSPNSPFGKTKALYGESTPTSFLTIHASIVGSKAVFLGLPKGLPVF